MLKFAERLEELLGEREMNQKTFAAEVGISEGSISLYMRDKCMPTVGHLIKLADYFHRSADFLLGREEENYNLTFRVCPPFRERIAVLKGDFGGTVSEFLQRAKVAKSCYFNWASGKFNPTLENIISLANNLDRRVDYILGRET